MIQTLEIGRGRDVRARVWARGGPVSGVVPVNLAREVVAEDLGVVPQHLQPSLERLAIPGSRVLRWEENGDQLRDPSGWPTVCVSR